jgi:hypothetical protein
MDAFSDWYYILLRLGADLNHFRTKWLMSISQIEGWPLFFAGRRQAGRAPSVELIYHRIHHSGFKERNLKPYPAPQNTKILMSDRPSVT